jgi:hypothetical protein
MVLHPNLDEKKYNCFDNIIFLIYIILSSYQYPNFIYVYLYLYLFFLVLKMVYKIYIYYIYDNIYILPISSILFIERERQ